MNVPVAQTVPGYNGVPLNLWDYGGDGIPLLLCHCNGAAARLWDPVVAALPAGFHVLALDSRGYGDSGAPARREECTPECSGRDILAVLSALELEAPIHALGHSIGGAHLAWAEYLAPGTFSSMVWIDPIIASAEMLLPGLELAAGARRRRNSFPSRQAALKRLGNKPPKDAWAPEVMEAYVRYALAEQPDGSAVLKCPGEREAWFYEMGATGEIYKHMDRIQAAILLLSAENSELLPLVQVQSQWLPQADLIIHPSASHFIPQEDPAWVAKTAGEWLLNKG